MKSLAARLSPLLFLPLLVGQVFGQQPLGEDHKLLYGAAHTCNIAVDAFNKTISEIDRNLSNALRSTQDSLQIFRKTYIDLNEENTQTLGSFDDSVRMVEQNILRFEALTNQVSVVAKIENFEKNLSTYQEQIEKAKQILKLDCPKTWQIFFGNED